MTRFWKVVALFVGAVAAVQVAQAADEADVFDRLDANHDGQVTRDEVGQDQMRLFRRLLRQSDKNEDGQLSKEEFVAGTTKQPDAADAADAGGQTPRARFNPQQVLARLDRNGDKKLSKEEAPERMRENFDRLDRNQDGFIDAEELARIGGNRPSDRPQGQADPARLAQMAERIFSQRDANSDGKITLDEIPEERRDGFRRMMERLKISPDDGLTKEQFTKAIGQFRQGAARPQGAQGLLRRLKAADANQDGKLSREEAPEQMKQFFDRIDGNSDGFLDATEIRRMIERRQQNAGGNSDRPQRPRQRPKPEAE